jgi:hypothetical protein
MKNKLSLSLIGPDRYRNYDPCSFKCKAEEDYIVGRYLALVGSNLSGLSLFHMQQFMEKYFKAFLIKNGTRERFDTTHNLERLAKFCSQIQPNSIFSDKDLQHACKVITPFEVVGRFQAKPIGQSLSKENSYSKDFPEHLQFFDELLYEMRSRFKKEKQNENIADAIQALFQLSQHPFKGTICLPLWQAFLHENAYAKKVQSQF